MSKTGWIAFLRPGKFHSQWSASEEVDPTDPRGSLLPRLNSKTCSWIWLSSTCTVLAIWIMFCDFKWLNDQRFFVTASLYWMLKLKSNYLLSAEKVTWIDFELLWIFLIASVIEDEVSADENEAEDDGDPIDEDDVEGVSWCEDNIGLLWITINFIIQMNLKCHLVNLKYLKISHALRLTPCV